MDAKRYLQSIKRYNDQINAMLKEREQLYSMATKITPTLSRDTVSGGGDVDKIGCAVSRIVDLAKEIDAEIDRYVDTKKEAFALLEKMENTLYHDILYRRYILFEGFEQIALELHYTHRWICSLHGRALQEFAKLMPDVERDK